MAGVMKDKSNEERIFIYLADDPKARGDHQGHLAFNMTSRYHGLASSLWPNCDSIQRKIR